MLNSAELKFLGNKLVSAAFKVRDALEASNVDALEPPLRRALEELVAGLGDGPGRRKVMDPIEPRTHDYRFKVVLALDNGVRIETGGVEGSAPELAPGSYVLLANVHGQEIGYWNASELAEAPENVLRQIFRTAALGFTLPEAL